MIPTKNCYQIRFSSSENKQKRKVWQVLCSSFFQQYVGRDDVVMDIGAGYCEFINNIACGKKIAVDINPDVKKFAGKDVETIKVSVSNISQVFDGKIDKIFMSNFLEHLGSKEEVLSVLVRANKLLKRNGKIIILQPNIDLVKEKYWDFFDHKIALNLESLKEALSIANFQVEKEISRFFPYTSKSFLPKNSFLVKLYLKIPPFLRPFAGQSFVLATKNAK